MAGTRKHEDKTREQTCDNTRETNAEIKHNKKYAGKQVSTQENEGN